MVEDWVQYDAKAVALNALPCKTSPGLCKKASRPFVSIEHGDKLMRRESMHGRLIGRYRILPETPASTRQDIT